MKTTDESEILMEKIMALKHQQDREQIVLKEQLRITYESVKPLNFLKETLHNMTTSPEVKNDLLNGAVNMTSYLLSNNPVLSSFKKPIKKAVSRIFQFVFKNFISRK